MADQLRRTQQEWLEARLHFRNVAKKVMFLGKLYPEGTKHDHSMNEKLYGSYMQHADAAYALLRKTMALWEVEEPCGVAGTLPVDLQVEDGVVDIASLAFALQRNESMIKALHRALGVLLSYISHERHLLQESHRDEVSSSK